MRFVNIVSQRLRRCNNTCDGIRKRVRVPSSMGLSLFLTDLSIEPYECDHPGCGKRFSIMGALTIHKRMHNGDKPFKCPQCDKAFSESSNLSKHVRLNLLHPHCFGKNSQFTSSARTLELDRMFVPNLAVANVSVGATN